MTRLASRASARLVAAVVAVFGAGLLADSLAVVIKHGEGNLKHMCWICEPNPPAGTACTWENAAYKLECRTTQCASCGWSNGSPVMSCGSCNNGLPEDP